MRNGSVIVDLAAASGGNCELTIDGKDVVHAGVTIIGASDLPSEVATTASSLYARNVTNMVFSDGHATSSIKALDALNRRSYSGLVAGPTVNVWTIDGSPFTPADRTTATSTIAYGISMATDDRR